MKSENLLTLAPEKYFQLSSDCSTIFTTWKKYFKDLIALLKFQAEDQSSKNSPSIDDSIDDSGPEFIRLCAEFKPETVQLELCLEKLSDAYHQQYFFKFALCGSNWMSTVKMKFHHPVVNQTLECLEQSLKVINF